MVRFAKIKAFSEKPLISIYVPTHNRPKLLNRALKSLINQSYHCIQIIVIADSCNLETHNLLQSYTKYDNRIEWYAVDFRSPAKTRNFAIAKANGLFITGLDDDDYLTADHIKFLHERFISLDTCPFLYFDHIELQSSRIKRVNKNSPLTLSRLYAYNNPGNQIFTYTKYLQDIGGFDESMKGWEDYDLWLRVTQRFGCGQRSKVPSYFMDTSHQGQRITTSNLNNTGALQFYEKHRNNMSFPTKCLHELECAYYNKSKFKFKFKYFYSLFSPCKIYALKLLVKFSVKIYTN